MSSYGDVPAAPNIHNYHSDHITLYGVKLNDGERAPKLPFANKLLRLEVLDEGGNPVGEKDVIIGVVYGYGFEGHCYRLDRPKLVIFDRTDDKPAKGCGFDDPYRMWRVRSKDVLLEFVMSVDTAETLILEANLPGNRAPNTYGNSMQLAHRGGRLNRNGSP
jgi:hypothetical protein